MATVVGSVVARVVPDTTGFATRLNADLQNLPTVKVNIEIDRASIAAYRAQVANLTRPVTLPVRVEVDRASIATYRAQVANLTQQRTMRVNVDLRGEAAARTRLDALARSRTSTVHVNVDSSATRTLGSIMSAASGAGSALAGVASKAMLLGSAIPVVGSLANAIAALAPAAALAAPAIAAVGSAVAAIKLGTAGLGNAFKQAFNPVAGGAAKAATSANQVESAQRSLKSAIDQVAVAKENAAEAIKNADRAINSAERDLADSQQKAKDAQQALNDARKQAVQDLEDLQRSLKHSVLDEREASLAVQEAQQRLYEVMSDSSASELQRQQAQLAYDEAIQNLDDQKAKTKELKKEQEAAAKAGVDGSKVVQDAQKNLSDAKQDVRDKTVAVKDAEAARDKAARDGARSVAQAQQAVADAQRQVAEAQQSAATSTSALNDAMSKLSPNAQSFVRTIQGLKPAWDAMQLAVQDRLFSGLSDKVRTLGQVGIPVLRQGLTGTAGVLNQMAKGALDAVTNLAKTGMLRQILDGATKSLEPLKKAPGQIVTAFGQIAVAAQPSFQKVTEGLGGAITRVTDKMSKAFESGAMQKAIENAVTLLGQLMDVAGNVFKILGSVFNAGAASGGSTVAMLKTITDELVKIFASKEVQAGLKALFSTMATLAKTVAPLLGTALKFVGQVMAQLGPPLQVLIKALGAALKPVIDALGPVLVIVAQAIGQLLVAISPLLPVLGQLIATALKPLGPLFKVIADLISQMSPVIAVLADALGQILTPILEGLGEVLTELVTQGAQQFMEVIKLLLPVIPELIPPLVSIAQQFGKLLVGIAPLIPQILNLSTQLLVKLLPAILPLLGPILELTELFVRFAVWAITGYVLPAIQGLIDYIEKIGRKLQPVIDAVRRFTEWIAKKFQWLYDVLVGHSIIPDMINSIRRWFDKGAKWIKEIWNSVWEHTIGKAKSATKWVTDKVSGFSGAVRDHFGNAKKWTSQRWSDMWSSISEKTSSFTKSIRGKIGEFRDAVVSSFRNAKDNAGAAWARLGNLAKNPVKFIVETVYNTGLVSVWNAVAGLVHAKKLDKLSLKGFATGGIMPGYTPGRDNQIIAVGGGEAIMRPEWTRAVGPGYVNAMNALARQGGIGAVQRALGLRAYADGGIVDGAGQVLGDIFSGGKKLLSKGVDLLKDGVEGAAKLALKPVKEQINDIPGSGKWTDLIKSVPKLMVNKLLDYFGGKAKEQGDTEGQYQGKVGKGVQQWTPQVHQALSELHQAITWTATVLRRMNQESGGNPNIVNKWDSNWQAGHPSVGLMQVIEGTFRAYAGRYLHRGPFSYGVSVDPLANIFAGLNYAIHRYGSLSALNRPGGYAKGGYPSAGELAWVGEEGPELVRFLGPAQVYTHSQSLAMAQKMGANIPGYAKGGTISETGKGSIASVIGKAFLEGLSGTTAEIKSAMSKVTTAIKNAFKGVKSTVDDKLLKYLGTQNKALTDMAKKRDLISGKIAAAKQLAADATGTAQNYLSLSSLPNGGLAFNTKGIINGLTTRLTQLRTFGSNLTKLAKMGVSQELIRQIVAMGPDSGAAYAAALVKATPAEVKSLNATQKAIDKASSKYGKDAADAAYDAGTQSGKGFLAGLQAQEKAITDKMSALAKKIQKTIKDALKIKSPSRVMAQIGMNVGQGLAQGIDASGSVITASSLRAASLATRVGSATASYTRAERVRDVHFNASVSDKPTRQMILDATKDYNALHGAGITY